MNQCMKVLHRDHGLNAYQTNQTNVNGFPWQIDKQNGLGMNLRKAGFLHVGKIS